MRNDVFVPSDKSVLHPNAKRWVNQPITVKQWRKTPEGLSGLVSEFGFDVSATQVAAVFNFFDEYCNVLGLASWLNSNYYFDGTDSMLYFFEKPWKWEREYFLWQACENCGDEQIAEEWVDHLYDNVEARELLLEKFPVPEWQL